MTGITYTSSQPCQVNFDTNGFFIGINNCCSVTMSYCKQELVGTLKKGQCIINGIEGPKMHTIYEGTITWTINDDSGHPNWVEISNSFYVPKGRERIISQKYLA